MKAIGKRRRARNFFRREDIIGIHESDPRGEEICWILENIEEVLTSVQSFAHGPLTRPWASVFLLVLEVLLVTDLTIKVHVLTLP